MLELTGIASMLRGASFVYWLLAIALLVLVAWKVKRWTYKVTGIAVVVGLFGYLPVQSWMEAQKREAYAREAWAYFKKLCDEKSGEKIYKTYNGVKSVLVVKPLPPATEKDLRDQFWYGDPYSDATPWDRRADLAASVLADPSATVSVDKTGRGYAFVESVVPGSDGAIVKYFYRDGARKSEKEIITNATSRFGISWEDISTPDDRKYWVAGSRLRVIDLKDKSIVAERIGYLIEAGFGSTSGQRRPWLTARGIGPNERSCPNAHDYSDRWFLLRVLKPELENSDGK